MKNNRRRTTWWRASLAVVLLLGVMLCVSPALADALGISGADHFFTADSDGAVDILTVTGAEGGTVYINMSKEGKKGSETLASHLAFTLDPQNAEADDNGNMVGAVSVEFNASAFSYDDTYTIEVFADRNEKNKLYEGTISTLFAQYGDKVEALAVRTLAEGESRPFTAPQTLERDGATYELKDKKLQDVDGKQCYVYVESGELADSIEGHVYYYDIANPTGDAIKTDTITLAKNSSQDVAIDSIIEADDSSLYCTLQLTGAVTLGYPGTSDYSIMCKAVTGATGAYRASIQFTDTEGNNLPIAADSVFVNKKFTYTCPSIVYVRDGELVHEYRIADRDKAVLQLEPGDAQEDTTYYVAYEAIPDNAPRRWTVVAQNGTLDPNDPKRVIKIDTYEGEINSSVDHVLEEIEVGGVTYVAVPDQDVAIAEDGTMSIHHDFVAGTMDNEKVVYYVPKGYVPAESYEVLVNYVNIATNEVIDSVTYSCTPSMRGDLEITSPETFSKDGIEWIRLNGQELPIRHSYYAGKQTYAVYYRDANDDSFADSIIRTVRVEYIDEEGNTIIRPTTVIDNGTTVTDLGTTDNGTTVTRTTTTIDGGTTTTETDGGTTDGGTRIVRRTTVIDYGTTTTDGGTVDNGTTTTTTAGQNGTAAGNGSTQTGIQSGSNVLSINGPNGDALVGSDGTGLNTMRIDDDATPLAGPGSTEAASKVNKGLISLGALMVAVVAGLLWFFLVYKRRKDDDEESVDPDATA